MRLFTSSFKLYRFKTWIRWVNLRKAVLLFLGFFIGILAITLMDKNVLHSRLLKEDEDVLIQKIRFFEISKDEYTAVFIGPSRIYHQVDTPFFDSAMQKNIQGFKSFNFGAPGIGWAEILYIIDYINALKPANLKYIFFEPIPYSKIYSENVSAASTLMAHDLRYTYLGIKNILQSDEAPQYLAHQTYYHIISFIYNLTCIGCASEYAAYKIRTKNTGIQKTDYSHLRKNSGFIPIDEDAGPLQTAKHQTFLLTAETKMADLVLKKISRLEKSDVNILRKNIADVQIETLLNAAKKLGPTPVIVVPPELFNHHRLDGRLEYFKQQTSAAILAFDDPRRYPEFCRIENRWEELHLNKKGARLFTERLADEFKKILLAESL